MRAKRTEWRMRGIEPNNKRNVVFPSSVLPSRCFGNPPPSSQHSCFAALAKNSHLWTVFTVLRTAASRPRGGRLNRLRTALSFRGVSNAVVAITRINQTSTLSFRAKPRNPHAIETRTSVNVMRRDEASRPTCPRWLTAVHDYPNHSPTVAHRREILCNRNVTSVNNYPGLSSAASCHTAWVGQEDSPHIFICSGLRL